MLYIELLGKTPSKKNSRNIFVRGGRIINIPSQVYKDWHDDAMRQISHKIRNAKIAKCEIEMVFYSGDARKWDLDNRSSSVLDTLVNAGVIEDDNYTVVQTLHLGYGGIDRHNPRACITITEL
jgi:Holliday junction resolvase RusA-like endonuclease